MIAYNNHNELSACLQSINQLNYPKELFEVIVIDDGSVPAMSNSIAKNFNYTYQFHYIPRTQTSCRSKARNTGAGIAKNELLLFLDGDQFINSDLLHNYNNYFIQNKHSQVVLGSRIDLSEWQSQLLLETLDINRVTKLIRNQDDSRLLIKQTLGEQLLNVPGVWTLFWSHNFIISRSIFESINGFDESFINWGFEDVELGYRLTQQGYTYEIIENNVFHFHEINKITAKKHYQWIKNMEIFYKKYNDISILCQWFFYESLATYTPINRPNAKEMHDMFIRYSSKISFIKDMEKENY